MRFADHWSEPLAIIMTLVLLFTTGSMLAFAGLLLSPVIRGIEDALVLSRQWKKQ